jgi:uncharacterized membrane protein YphA (DoxX/SURF4 family)
MAEGQTRFFKRQWKQDRFFSLIARLILGVVFIYASIDKILHPATFAEAVYNYQILPDMLINLTAIILPWLELLLGIFLVLGVCLQGVVFLSNMLLAIFFGALVFSLARGLDINCGCFSTSQTTSNLCMCLYVIRDSVFLIPAFFLFYCTFLRKKQTMRVNTHE